MGFDAFLAFATTFRPRWGDRGEWVPTTVAPIFDEKWDEHFECWHHIRGSVWYSLLSEPDCVYEFNDRWNVRPLFDYLNEEDRTKKFWGKLNDYEKNDYKLNYILNPPPTDNSVCDDAYALIDLEVQLGTLKEFLGYLVEVEKEQESVENPISFYFSFSY